MWIICRLTGKNINYRLWEVFNLIDSLSPFKKIALEHISPFEAIERLKLLLELWSRIRLFQKTLVLTTKKKNKRWNTIMLNYKRYKKNLIEHNQCLTVQYQKFFFYMNVIIFFWIYFDANLNQFLIVRSNLVNMKLAVTKLQDFILIIIAGFKNWMTFST